MLDGAAILVHEAATPMIGAERFGLAAGPNLHAPIANHRQLEIVRRHISQRLAQVVRRAFHPIQEHINAYQLLLGVRAFFEDRLFGKHSLAVIFVICDRVQRVRFLTETLDNGLTKFFSADFLLAYFIVVDVIRVDAVFDSAQPRV